jgi:chaperonin cofactor prefoldin
MKTLQELNNEYVIICQLYGDALFKLEDAEQVVATLKSTIEELKNRKAQLQQQANELSAAGNNSI